MANFLTIKETAAATRLSQYYLRRRCREGSVPVIRAGAKYLIDVVALNEQLAAEARRGVLSIGETS